MNLNVFIVFCVCSEFKHFFFHLNERQQSGSASLHAYCYVYIQHMHYLHNNFNKHSTVPPSYYPRLCSFHASQATHSVIQHLCSEVHFSSIFKFAINPCSHVPMMRGSVRYPFH